jgi:hypothetical protein
MPHIDTEEVIWNEVDGNVVLLQFTSGAYFMLNEVGSKIWKLLDEGKTIAEIATALQPCYDPSKEILEQDIHDFINHAITKGFVSE